MPFICKPTDPDPYSMPPMTPFSSSHTPSLLSLLTILNPLFYPDSPFLQKVQSKLWPAFPLTPTSVCLFTKSSASSCVTLWDVLCLYCERHLLSTAARKQVTVLSLSQLCKLRPELCSVQVELGFELSSLPPEPGPLA
jgi:hypothetical protein